MEYSSFDHKRTVLDAGSMLGSGAAFRILGMYENSGSYRDFVDLDRWAVNPVVAFKLNKATKLTLGYEHAEDKRTADRGIPSFKPLGSFYGFPAPTARSTFFGNPDLSHANATVDRLYAIAEHNTAFGLSVRNHTSWVNYDKFYQNVYPGTPLNAPGNGLVGILAYNNETDRENLFNRRTSLISSISD